MVRVACTSPWCVARVASFAGAHTGVWAAVVTSVAWVVDTSPTPKPTLATGANVGARINAAICATVVRVALRRTLTAPTIEAGVNTGFEAAVIARIAVIIATPLGATTCCAAAT